MMRVAVLPGDGVGPKLAREAVKVLRAAERIFMATRAYLSRRPVQTV